jgi:lysophospholipase L1-like esterase
MQSLSYEADVVFFGASLTSDGHWEDYFDSLKICNLGKSGDRLDMMLWRVPQITAVHPKKVFLSMEQNDMHILTINEIEKAYNTLIDTIVQTNPQAKLYLESLTPLNERQFGRVCDNVKIRKVNELIERVAKERGFTYIDIYSIYEQDGQLSMSISTDGQHLVPEAYLKWTEAIKPFLN